MHDSFKILKQIYSCINLFFNVYIGNYDIELKGLTVKRSGLTIRILHKNGCQPSFTCKLQD